MHSRIFTFFYSSLVNLVELQYAYFLGHKNILDLVKLCQLAIFRGKISNLRFSFTLCELIVV